MSSTKKMNAKVASTYGIVSKAAAETFEAKRPAPEERVSESLSTNQINAANGAFVPSIDPTFFITSDIESLFRRVSILSKKSTQKVLLRGPHGAGKTETAMQYAARTGKQILIMDCANLREARDWFGYKTIEDGKIVWHTSQFDKVISKGNCVILLDEANRVHPTIFNTLYPLLDGRGFTYFEEKGGCITVGPNVVFFSTMNEGAAYTGTTTTDVAMRDRLGQRTVEVTYLPADKEVELLVKRTGIKEKPAKDLVNIANQIRAKSTGINSTFSEGFSTRQLIACAEDYVIDGAETLTFTMSNLFSAEGGTSSERATVLQLIQGKFGAEIVKDAKTDAADTLMGTTPPSLASIPEEEEGYDDDDDDDFDDDDM